MLIAVVAAMLVAVLGVALGGRDGGDAAGPVRTSTTSTEEPSTTSSGPSPTTTTSTSTTTTTPSTTATSVATGPAVAVRQGPTDERIVALTFDAGSDTGYAAAILDTLAGRGVPASFGLTGLWTEANRALVRRMAAEGHQLLNHTWSHPSFTGYSTGTARLSTGERLAQLARAEDAIRSASGVAAWPWFRPPYGDEDESVRIDVGSAGYAYEAMWTVDSLGWKGIPAAEVVARCLDRAEPGAIYLFHVGSASTDAEALPAIIDGLRAEGYGFATLADLVAG